jgi:hypothetical protein
MDYALPLIEHLSGGPCDESSAYLKWLNERTRTLLGQSDVWLAVEAVTEALLDRRTLPAREARRVVKAALDTDHQKHLAAFRARTTRS